MNRLNQWSLVGVLIGAVTLGSGCATNRGILDIRMTIPEDPASGRLVTIARVTDHRQFQVAPPEAWFPSLKEGEITDKAITSRAIARKRGAFGKAIGDILLPEGRSVEDLVKEALTRSFREAGYRVIDQGTISQDKATPVEADIEQFWAWFRPGFAAVSLQFEAKVKITCDVPPFKTGETVRGYLLLHSQAATTLAWQNTINKGINAFVQEVKNRLTTQ